jgi:hypothetical protein
MLSRRSAIAGLAGNVVSAACRSALAAVTRWHSLSTTLPSARNCPPDTDADIVIAPVEQAYLDGEMASAAVPDQLETAAARR